MAGNRTLKLSILADVDDLKKKLGTGSDEVEGFGSKLTDFGKKAGLAFAAAGAAAAVYAGKLLVDGVKAAIEDEAAQEKLAATLRNVTGATNDQIKSVEDQILKLELANGVTDDQLRPSFERLVRATKDLSQATKLQTLALDISAGSGKDLESVTNALGRAYEGSTTALSKLGLGLTKAQLSTMSFDEITKQLAATFGGQAAEKADTFQGKMARLNIAFSEAKETVGSYVIDALTPLLDNFVNVGIPAISAVADEIGKNLGPTFEKLGKLVKEDIIPIVMDLAKFVLEELWPTLAKILRPAIEGLTNAFDTIRKAIRDNSDELEPFINILRKLWDFTKNTLAPVLGGTLKIAFEVIGTAVSVAITNFSHFVGVIENVYNKIKSLIDFLKNNPLSKFLGNLGGSIIDNSGSRAFTTTASSTDTAPIEDPYSGLFSPAGIRLQTIQSRKLPPITVQVMSPSIIDEEGFSRAVVDALNNSYNRLGAGGAQLAV